MHLETGLETIRRLSEKRNDENWRFRTFLKGYGGDGLDERVHRILAEVATQIDCTQCGNCCVDLRPEMTDGDVERLALRLSMTPQAFRDQYIDEKGDYGGPLLKGQPCPFLEDRRCTVYAAYSDDSARSIRRKAPGDSEGIRPPVPIDSAPLFRSNRSVATRVFQLLSVL